VLGVPVRSSSFPLNGKTEMTPGNDQAHFVRVKMSVDEN
jgi:hypothetical protein